MNPYSLLTTTALLFSVAMLPSSIVAKTLNEKITTEDDDYDIQFRNKDATDTDWFTSDGDAQRIADHFDPDSGDGIHSRHQDLNFREASKSRRDVKITKHDGNPSANYTRIRLPVDIMNDVGHGSSQCLGICTHEGHHIHQYEYVGPDSSYGKSSFGLIGFEGPATAMMDCVFTGLDDAFSSSSADIGWTHVAWLSTYLDTDDSLASNHDDYFWGNNGYESALFWRYLMEQFGSNRTEPEVGVDFLRRFYQLADANKEGIATTMRDVLDEKDRWSTTDTDTGVSLEEAFQDFSIANWTRRYRNPNSWATGFSIDVGDPARFQYVDEDPAAVTNSLFQLFTDSSGNLQWVGSANDERPAATGTHSLTPGNNTGLQTVNLDKWATRYLSCSFSGSGAGYGIGFWAEAEDGGTCWYSLIGRRASGSIDLIEKGTTTPDSGNSFRFATMQDAVDPYVELIAVVNGESGPSESGFTYLTVDSEYYFSYFAPTIDILEPTADYKAYVGDGAEPERFIVKLAVTSPDYLGTASVEGLTADHFNVWVGSSATSSNSAEVINAAYVLGEYWLTCQAPVKSPSPTTAQSIIVHLGSASDVEERAVVYADLEVDQMLVIDRSGSMSQLAGGVERIEAARSAAQLFIDASGSDDQIGVVRFNGDGIEPDATSYGDADVIYSLQQMNSQFERDLVNLLIDDANPGGDMLSPTGLTSIGDGLYWGAKEIIDHGKTESEKWIILLSDGHQNEDSEYDDHKSLLEAAGIRIETIALGDGVDKNLLQQISHETSGRYYEVTEASTGSAFTTTSSMTSSLGSSGGSSGFTMVPGVTSSLGSSNSMLLDLADRYLLASERIHRRERLLERCGTLSASGSESISMTLAEGGLEDCVITLVASQSSASPSLSVTRPGGAVVPAPAEGYTASVPDGSGNWWDPEYHVSYRIGNMEDGEWIFDLSNGGSSSFDYLFVISGKNREGAQSFLYFTQFHGDPSAYASNGLYLIGLPQPLTIVLTDGNGPLIGADVTATVSHPNRPDTILRLRDDGGSHDGAANDGVYSAVFAATTEGSASGGSYPEGNEGPITGSYEVTVNSSGIDNLGRHFQRVDRGSFHLFKDQEIGSDSDFDGMPDTYEDLHDGLNKFANDAAGDCDGDGLANLDEYQRGTNPCDIDTDGGGETDKSEVDAGANPLDHTDDVFRAPLMARCLTYSNLDHSWPEDPSDPWYPESGENIILFSLERGYESYEIFRSTAPTGPFTLIGTGTAASDEGVYYDGGLTNGTTYHYYVVPIGAGGRRGVPTYIFEGTPSADSTPPEGWVAINRGADHTTSNNVSLSFAYDPSVTEMRFGNTRDLSAQPWIPAANFIGSHLMVPTLPGLEGFVFAELRDATGNVSRISDSIGFLDPATAAIVTGQVIAPVDIHNGNIRIAFEDPAGRVLHAITQPSGNFALPLPPETYLVRIDQRGYQPLTLPAALYAPGSVTALGTLGLLPLDSDGDALSDVEELRDHDTDRYAGDSDGDGHSDGDEVLVLMTDPNDPNSLLRIGSLDAIDPATGEMTITFDSVGGVTYRFEVSSDLKNWNVAQDGGSDHSVTATGNSTSVTVQGTAGTRQFIRVIAP